VNATVNSSEGAIPKNTGTPFYTIDENPRYPDNLSCLINLSENSSCAVSWRINATGDHNTTYGISAYFNSTASSNKTSSVNVTIISLTPIITNPSPGNNTTFEPYTTYFTLSVATHITSLCRHSNVSGVPYDNMTETFSNTNSTTHSTNITGLSDNKTVNVYVRCRSIEGFSNPDDYHLRYRISFPQVVLNELSPTSEWIELYNRGETQVNLSSWTIEHQYDTTSVNHTLTSTIGKFMLTNVSLNDAYGTVRLYDRYGNLADNVTYGGNITENKSYGRSEDGSATWVVFTTPTPGSTNRELYSSEWPMFRQNPARTGETTTNVSRYLIHKWNTTIGDRVRSSPAISGGIAYACSWNGSITALNTSSGNIIWTYSAGDFISSSPAIADGRIFTGKFNVASGTLLSLNATTGDHIWNRSFSGEIESSPLAYGGVVYIGVNDGRIYALNATTGASVWNRTIGSQVRSSPATSGGVLFFGSNDKRVYALNASTGAHLWNYTTAGIVYSTPAVSSGLVVFGSYDNRVYALNASTGTYIWNYTTSGGVWSSPAVSGNAVYVGSNDRKIYALNLSTGALIWSTTTGFDVVSSPAVSQELVFAGSKDDVLWGLDRGNGSVLWNINLGTDLVSSPAIAGGMVFTGADDGRVYAFGLYNDTTPPNISLIWPENGSTDSDGNLTLVYKVSDEGSNISSCALSLNGLLNQTSPNILENVNQSFSAYNLVNGSYNWSVSCTDESVNLNVGESPTWHFNVSINPLINFLDDLSSGWNLLSIPVAIQG
jgi:outer membrane protein assembly factor BamB